MDFSTLDWPSILVGFGLSIFGVFISNSIQRYFGRSKIYVSRRRKEQALRDLELINSFQEDGTRAVIWATSQIIFFTIMVGTMLIFVLFIFFGRPFIDIPFGQDGIPYKILATINLFAVFWYFVSITRISRRYNNFGDFILQLKTNFDIDAIAVAKSRVGE